MTRRRPSTRDTVESSVAREGDDGVERLSGLAGCGQVGQVESEVVKDGKTSHEIRYFITSVSRPVAGAGQLLESGPGHWSVENRSHYVRDVTMGETQPDPQAFRS